MLKLFRVAMTGVRPEDLGMKADFDFYVGALQAMADAGRPAKIAPDDAKILLDGIRELQRKAACS